MHLDERPRPIPWGLLSLPLVALAALFLLVVAVGCGDHRSALRSAPSGSYAYAFGTGYGNEWWLPEGEFSSAEQWDLERAADRWLNGRPTWHGQHPPIPGWAQQWAQLPHSGGYPQGWRFLVTRGVVTCRWTGEDGWDVDLADPYRPVVTLQAGAELTLPRAGRALLHCQPNWLAPSPGPTPAERQDWARVSTWLGPTPVAWAYLPTWEGLVISGILAER